MKTQPLDLLDDPVSAQHLRVICHGKPRQHRVGYHMLHTGQLTHGLLDRARLGRAAHAGHRANKVTRLERQVQAIAQAAG